MPLIECIELIFPEKHAPYTMREIIQRLQLMYSNHITRTAVYRARTELANSETTAALVRPLDPMASELLYSHQAAIRIARKTIRNRTPAQIAPKMLPAPAFQVLETRVGLK